MGGSDSDGAGWLRVRRTEALLSQEELARRSGVDARTIRDIETGRTAQPRASTVRLLRDALAATERETTGSVPPRVPTPRELPPDTTGFTGRADQLAKLDLLLDPTEQPTAVVICAVSGTAGVGKTTLAVHWAHRVATQFPGGQLYVDLRGYDPELPVRATDALAAFLRSLGVADAKIPPEQAERANRYRTLLAGRRMLILLDNALGVEQLRDLLPGTPGTVVLITSRDTLAGLAVHHGAQRIDLEPLPAQDARDLLRTHIGPRAGCRHHLGRPLRRAPFGVADHRPARSRPACPSSG